MKSNRQAPAGGNAKAVKTETWYEVHLMKPDEEKYTLVKTVGSMMSALGWIHFQRQAGTKGLYKIDPIEKEVR